MQIPSNSNDKFIQTMTEKSEKIRSLFLENIKHLTKTIPVKVMLGDSTVSDQQTFDPGTVRQFYGDVLKKMPQWNTEGISTSNEKDLRRLTVKFEIKEGNFLLSCRLALQYHALLFYKLNHDVVEIQKRIAEITEKIDSIQKELAPQADLLIKEKLKENGYENVDQQKLFEIFFTNDDLIKEIADQVYSSFDVTYDNLIKGRSALFKELDILLIEIYCTTPVMIDEIRMIAAEEGCLCLFDLQHVKKKEKEGNFDPARISSKVKEDLLKRMDEVLNAIKI